MKEISCKTIWVCWICFKRKLSEYIHTYIVSFIISSVIICLFKFFTSFVANLGHFLFLENIHFIPIFKYVLKSFICDDTIFKISVSEIMSFISFPKWFICVFEFSLTGFAKILMSDKILFYRIILLTL